MKRVAVAILAAFLAVPAAGTAFSDEGPDGAPANDCLAGGIAVCSLMTPDAGRPTETRAARRAVGVITRGTATEGRYAVREVSGFFGAKGQVSIYTPQGEFIARGTVRDIFDDELYVDVAGSPATPPAVGFAVLMNYPEDEARRTIAASRDAFSGATAEAKADAKQVTQEIAADARREAADRLNWQEGMEKLKYQLGFYESRYYYYVPNVPLF